MMNENLKKVYWQKWLLTLLAILMFNIGSFAQESRSISGKVTDSGGGSIPGVSVSVKGQTVGTITDGDGRYTLKVPSNAKTLVFSFVGLKTSQVTIGTSNVVDISLQEDARLIEETVVVAYGTQKKRDVIGSVSRIGGENLTRMSVSSFDQALQGMAPGLQVTANSGTPGAPVQVKIRGVSSITSSTEPLWIVDGIPVKSDPVGASFEGEINQSPMSMINPSDIESVEVLKDAAATAIYGSRASNGVILVTTKSGKKGKGSLDVEFKSGVSNFTKSDIGLANSEEYFKIMDIAKTNTPGIGGTYDPQSDIIRPLLPGWKTPITRAQAEATNTNWYDQLTRQGSFNEMNLSSSKGFDKGSMYVSLNYRDDKGNMKFSDLQRYTGRINLNYSASKNLDLGFRLMVSNTKNNRLKSQEGKGNSGGWQQMMLYSLPWMPVYEATDPSGYWNPATGANALAGIDPANALSTMNSFRTIGNATFELRLPFVEGLSIKGEAGFDVLNNRDLSWQSKAMREEGNDIAKERKRDDYSTTYNIYGNYNRTFKEHSLTVVAGHERQSNNAHEMRVEGKNLLGQYKEVGTPTTPLVYSSNWGWESYFMAYFGRINYKFKDRYLFGASSRYDGSSKFSSDTRWGLFSSLSAGWIISDEAFFNKEIFNLLKLRGSFGQTGNQNIPANTNVTTYAIKTGTGTYQSLSSAYINSIGNTSVSWEVSNNYDLGVDFGLFNNRINGSVAYFLKDVNKLLLAVPLPASAGIIGGNSLFDNIGDMQSKGLEFNISAAVLNKNQFKWDVTLNYTHNTNKVVNLTPQADKSGSGVLVGNALTKSGLALGTYFMAESAGIEPQKGIPMIYEIDQTVYKASGNTVKTGKIIPATMVNLLGNRMLFEGKTGLPKFYGGIQNTFSYKNFDLGIYVSFSGGNYIYNAHKNQVNNPSYGIVQVYNELLYDRWQKPGDIAGNPQLMWNSVLPYDSNGNPVATPAKYFSASESKYLEKGDYVRLKNLVFGYNLPQSILNRLKINGARIYFSGTNLLTFTKFTGWDPELPLDGNIGGVNFTSSSMPQSKAYSLGLNLKF
jgi:TonB-linked SusC/RagA family outer membrane protein